MKVYFIGAGPGDPELITIKGKKAIENSGYCIYTGSLVNKDILNYTKPGTKIYDSASMTLEEVLAVIKEANDADENVARLHTGDPSIYGAIQEQMQALDAMGIEHLIIPGVSSFTAAAASLKQELTLPGVSQTIIITRIKGKTSVPEKENLQKLAQSNATLCIFLSIKQLEKVTIDLIKDYGKNCPVAVVYKATWSDEKIIRGTLEDIGARIKKSKITKTAMIIIGWVLEKDFEASRLYNKDFEHGCRKKKTSAKP
ncbi:MAG: precorrin-4 C(11)-methyltransferase [Candidatus Anammoxibacter sp.]